MTKLEKLEQLYASLPEVKCKRLCQAYCGPLVIPKMECDRIEEKVGWVPKLSVNTKKYDNVNPTGKPKLMGDSPDYSLDVRNLSHLVAMQPGENTTDCRFLMPFPIGTCRIHSIRPLVCRLWGCISDDELMRCPHGCVPNFWLTSKDFTRLIEKVIEIQKGEGT